MSDRLVTNLLSKLEKIEKNLSGSSSLDIELQHLIDLARVLVKNKLFNVACSTYLDIGILYSHIEKDLTSQKKKKRGIKKISFAQQVNRDYGVNLAKGLWDYAESKGIYIRIGDMAEIVKNELVADCDAMQITHEKNGTFVGKNKETVENLRKSIANPKTIKGHLKKAGIVPKYASKRGAPKK